MTEIKSDTKSINTSDKDIFNFLSDFNNFGKLMPEQVINWQATENNCSFTIKGMADLAMCIDQKTEFSSISYTSEGKKPFTFSLNSHLAYKENNSTDVQIVLSADLSPVFKMMAAKPLQNFVNILVEKLKELMEN